MMETCANDVRYEHKNATSRQMITLQKQIKTANQSPYREVSSPFPSFESSREEERMQFRSIK